MKMSCASFRSIEDEGGKPADTANLVLLVTELRQALGKQAIISLASPADTGLAAFDVKALSAGAGAPLDLFNIMVGGAGERDRGERDRERDRDREAAYCLEMRRGRGRGRGRGRKGGAASSLQPLTPPSPPADLRLQLACHFEQDSRILPALPPRGRAAVRGRQQRH